MALFRKLFYRKPPDGLLEICEKVYVFDCCFATDSSGKDDYKVYIRRIVDQFREQFPDSSVLVFNFRGGDGQSELSSILSELDVTIMDYPRQYEGCPLLTMEVIHHFLRSCESWLSLGQNNLLMMHCERGGWPVLAFMLAGLLLYMKLYHGEQRTLDMVYREAPRELLQLLSPLNPMPSQLRYLQYVSRRNVGTEWPPLDRALTLDCVIMRLIPNFDKEGGCRPMFKIYGQDPFLVNDRTPKRLFSTPRKNKNIRAYKQAECELVKIDINCHIQGDVVVECITLCEDGVREEMMFRVMFNTAFIRSNILMLNRDEIDILWDAKDLFPKEFRLELLFSEMDAATSIVPTDFSCFEEKEGLPIEAFAKVQEMFNHVDWLDPVTDAALHMLQKIKESNINPENLHMKCRHGLEGCCSPKTSPKYYERMQRIRRQSSSSFDEEDLLSPAQKSSPRRTMGGRTSQSMPVITSSKLDPSALILGDQTSPPTSTVKSPQDDASPKSTQPTESSIAPPSAVQDPKETYSHEAIAPTNTRTSPLAPATTPPQRPSIVDSAVETPPPTSVPPPSPEPTIVDSASKTPSPTSVPPPPPPKLVPSLQEETIRHSQESSATPSVNQPAPSPTPPFSPTPSSPSSILKGPPVTPAPPPAPLTPAQPLAPPPPPFTPAQPPAPPPPPPPPPPPTPPLSENRPIKTTPLPPAPPPFPSGQAAGPKVLPPAPPQAPPPPNFSAKQISGTENSLGFPLAPPPPTKSSSGAPPAPPPPAKNSSGVPSAPPPILNSSGLPSAPPPPAPPGKAAPTAGCPSPPPPLIGSAKGRGLSRSISKSSSAKKLKPLHWLKLSRAVQGSIWAEAQKSGEATKAPEIDMSELETLFSASVPASDSGRKPGQRGSNARKPDKVQLIDHRRAYNCEIMLSKVKVPLNELMGSVLALEDSALDIDQVENLIKFCPTKEEMELLKGYNGEKDKLGRCEQFFLELMQVPRVESKLRVFSFKLQFGSQVSDLRKSLNVVNSAAEEIRDSLKLKRIMQTILSLGNALNQGTARGSAIGFRLDSLLKLTETRARNNKTTLMHYLCKVLADKLPEVLDFSKDLANTEPAAKVQLKYLAEEMQAISKGLEKVVQELALAENDGPISEDFCQILKEFLHLAEAEVRSLASLYSGVGRNVDALILYFGEDPARCPFEQVISTLMNFQRMFNKAHEENCKQIELEMKKEAENDKSKMNSSHKEADHFLQRPIQSSNVH